MHRDARNSKHGRPSQSLKLFGHQDCSHRCCKRTPASLKVSAYPWSQKCPVLHDDDWSRAVLATCRQSAAYEHSPVASLNGSLEFGYRVWQREDKKRRYHELIRRCLKRGRKRRVLIIRRPRLTSSYGTSDA